MTRMKWDMVGMLLVGHLSQKHQGSTKIATGKS